MPKFEFKAWHLVASLGAIILPIVGYLAYLEINNPEDAALMAKTKEEIAENLAQVKPLQY